MKKVATNVINWIKLPDGRFKLWFSTRNRQEAEEAAHVFAGLVKADVVDFKADKNGLYEATLRCK